MSTKDKVRQASAEFYAALTRMANGDASSMAGIWVHTNAVTAMHPIPGRDIGWKAVRKSFAQVATLASEGKVRLKRQVIQVFGNVACEMGIEVGRFKMAGKQVAIEQRVTNVYQRKRGSWKMIHHHADLSPAMIAVLKRL